MRALSQSHSGLREPLPAVGGHCAGNDHKGWANNKLSPKQLLTGASKASSMTGPASFDPALRILEEEQQQLLAQGDATRQKRE